jgi:hypothetical protein
MATTRLSLAVATIAVIGATNLPAWAEEVQVDDGPAAQRATRGVAEKQEDQQTPVTLLRGDETVKDLGGNAGTAYYFQIYVAPNADRLAIDASGGSGDADIYLAYGRLPQPDKYDYVSNKAGTADRILLRNPRAGTWYVLVFGYERFSDVSLTGSWYQEAQADYYQTYYGDYAPDTIISVPWATVDYEPAWRTVILCERPRPWFWFSTHCRFHRDRDSFYGPKPVFYRPSRPIYHHYTSTHYMPAIIRRPGGIHRDWDRRDGGFDRRDGLRDGVRHDGGFDRRDGHTNFSGRTSSLPMPDTGRPRLGASQPLVPAIPHGRGIVDSPRPLVKPSVDAVRPAPRGEDPRSSFRFGRTDEGRSWPSRSFPTPQPDVRRSAPPEPRVSVPARTMPTPRFGTEAPRPSFAPRPPAEAPRPSVAIPRLDRSHGVAIPSVERSPSPGFRSESPRFTPRSSASDSPRTFAPPAEVRRWGSRAGDSARSDRSDRPFGRDSSRDGSPDRDGRFGGGRK